MKENFKKKIIATSSHARLYHTKERERGFKEALEMITISMLQKGYKREEISEVTLLPIEEIIKLELKIKFNSLQIS